MITHRNLSSRQRYEQSPLLRGKSGLPEKEVESDNPQRQVSRQRSLLELYRELYRLLARHRGMLLGSLVLLSLAMAMKMIVPLTMKLAIDTILLRRSVPVWIPPWVPIPSDPKGQLVALFGMVLMFATLGIGLSLLSRWWITLVSKRTHIKVSRQAFEHASRLPLHRINQLKAGGMTSILRDDVNGIGELVMNLVYIPWRASMQLLIGLVALILVDWRLLVCSLILVPTVFFSHRLWSLRLRPIYREIRGERQHLSAKTTEIFGGVRIVRAFGRQRSEVLRFVQSIHFLTRLELLGWRWGRSLELLWEFALPLSSGLLMLYGGLRVLDGYLSPGELMMFLVYLVMLLEPIALLSNSFTQVQGLLAGFDRVLDLLAEPREAALNAGGVKLSKNDVRGGIRLDRVSFQYPNSTAVVLKEISLDVKPGEMIALVGQSGSGKTTLCNLIARFYDPSQGTIQLDQRDLGSIDIDNYRQLLGIVEQDVFLFDGTIAENIAYARRNATPHEIEQAAKVAHCAEFIESFPDRYDTMIGERGIQMSGGQRQRLAIARAVLADARILIMDEATSNLDSESEKWIQLSLDDVLKGRTSFVIAHRLSTVRHADRILVMDGGRIVEIGNHETLLAKGGRYQEMVALQSLHD